MTEQSLNADSWQCCPTGAITDFSARDRWRRNTKQLSRISAAVAVGCAMMAAVYFAFPTPNLIAIPYKGGLSCHEVLENIGPFFGNQLASDYRNRVLKHLGDCPRCDQIYQERAMELGTQVAGLIESETTSGGRHSMHQMHARLTPERYVP